jgi:hypothetical protein
LSVSVLIPLGAGAWWWVKWPERTAREFLYLIRTDQLESAQEILLFGPPHPNCVARTPYWKKAQLQAVPRTFKSYVLAQQRFIVNGDDEYELFVDKSKLAIEYMDSARWGIILSSEVFRDDLDPNLPRRVRRFAD